MSATTAAPHEFVHTVLLVDDQALGARPDRPADGGQAPHPVASKIIVDRLADQGLSCTLLAPGTPQDPDRARVVALARTADIVVLDWVLVMGAPGQHEDSLPILESIVRNDLQEGGRLRLVVIYTGYERPDDILDDVEGALRGLGLRAERNGTRVTAPNVHVLVLGKPDTTAEIDTADGAALADRLPKEFTDAFADGLLRRVALASVTAVRRHVHQLLTRFPSDLDEAYMSHRGMTSPIAAEQFARQLVSDEISSLLLDAAVERWVHQDEIDAALGERLQGSAPRHMATNRIWTKSQQLDVETARELLSKTKDGHPSAAGKKWEEVWTLTGLFDPSGDRAAAEQRARGADESFTVLATFSRHHDEPARPRPDPHLGLGAVLERDGQQWLCMQPLCDGARLPDDEPTTFPLLPFKAVNDDADFDLVLPGAAPRTRLKLVVKLNRLLMPQFLPVERGAVTAPADGSGERRVMPEPPEGPFRWVGQLRLDQAHRFAALLGTSAGRIGLDEPEWSRKRAGRS